MENTGRHIPGKVFRFYWNGLNYISDDLRAPFITITSFWSTKKLSRSVSLLPLFHIAKMKKNWTCFFCTKKVSCLFSLFCHLFLSFLHNNFLSFTSYLSLFLPYQLCLVILLFIVWLMPHQHHSHHPLLYWRQLDQMVEREESRRKTSTGDVYH